MLLTIRELQTLEITGPATIRVEHVGHGGRRRVRLRIEAAEGASCRVVEPQAPPVRIQLTDAPPAA